MQHINLSWPSSETSHLPQDQIQPYVDRLARRFPMWKGSLLDVQGRLILVKAVMTALSIYIMMALDLPKWAIDAMEKLCRGFPWCAKESARGGSCPLSFVCTPTKFGGLGIHNLHLLNDALRMKWLWLNRQGEIRSWRTLQNPCSTRCNAILMPQFGWSLVMAIPPFFGVIGGSIVVKWRRLCHFFQGF
jgi:hypothetical protein